MKKRRVERHKVLHCRPYEIMKEIKYEHYEKVEDHEDSTLTGNDMNFLRISNLGGVEL